MAQERAADDRQCAEALRTEDPEGWLAALFVPGDRRPHVQAVRAAFVEFGRVRDRVKQPLAGELRLQWWQDALAGEARGDAAAHPIAAALLDTIDRFSLPRDLVAEAIEAQRVALYDVPLTTIDAFRGSCMAIVGGRIRLECQILAGSSADAETMAGDAAIALGSAAVLRSLYGPRPRTALVPDEMLRNAGTERGALEAGPSDAGAVHAALRLLARSHLARLGAAAPSLPLRTGPAFLPVALVEPVLRASERRPGRHGQALALPRWRVQWALWRAARRGRVL